MVEQPKLVQLDDAGYYVLPIAREFVDVMPPRGEEGGRIRLHLGAAITLDVPLSKNDLFVLEKNLRQYLARRGP